MPSVRVTSAADIAEGRVVAVDVVGRSIALCRVRDRICAVENVCPHEHWSLDDGYVIDGRIVCSLHGAAFDVHTGACTRGPADRPIATFPVEIRDGVIVVHLPDAPRTHESKPGASS